MLHSICDADASRLTSLCESLVEGDEGCDRPLVFSLPSGIRRGTSGEVETTGAFENPNMAMLWRMVAPIVAGFDRRNFTNLQIHLNNSGVEHTDQGDVPRSALLVVGDFAGGAFRLRPGDGPTVEVNATQHIFEFDGSCHIRSTPSVRLRAACTGHAAGRWCATPRATQQRRRPTFTLALWTGPMQLWWVETASPAFDLQCRISFEKARWLERSLSREALRADIQSWIWTPANGRMLSSRNAMKILRRP